MVMKLNVTAILRLLAGYLFATAIAGVTFLLLDWLGAIDSALPRSAYIEGFIEIPARFVLSYGLWQQKRWSIVASIGYFVLVSVYLLIEVALLPVQAWTSFYLALMLMLNGMVLILLNRVLMAQPEMQLGYARHFAIPVFSLGLFFFVAFLFNTIIAAFLLISIAIGTRFGTKRDSSDEGPGSSDKASDKGE